MAASPRQEPGGGGVAAFVLYAGHWLDARAESRPTEPLSNGLKLPHPPRFPLFPTAAKFVAGLNQTGEAGESGELDSHTGCLTVSKMASVMFGTDQHLLPHD